MNKYSLLPFLLIGSIADSMASSNTVISDINVTPIISWPITNGLIYSIEASSTATGIWIEVDRFYSRTNSFGRWADLKTTNSPNGFYRVTISTNTSHFNYVESFEDVTGWNDMPSSSWTTTVASGKWVSGAPDFQTCYVASNQSRANTGSRYLGHTFIGQGFSAVVELPTTDSPTQISWWARGSTIGNNGQVQVFYHDGFAWQLYSFHDVNGLVYSQRVVNLSPLGIPNPQQRLRLLLNTTSAIYVDDVSLTSPQ